MNTFPSPEEARKARLEGWLKTAASAVLRGDEAIQPAPINFRDEAKEAIEAAGWTVTEEHGVWRLRPTR